MSNYDSVTLLNVPCLSKTEIQDMILRRDQVKILMINKFKDQKNSKINNLNYTQL